jgi:hypothetical protein
LRDECDWGLGFEQELNKNGGGIGASGATIVSLVLGVIGTVPTIQMLLDHLRREVPACPERDEAWDTATWAVALQYTTVRRGSLRVAAEVRHSDHWEFTIVLPESNDQFTVDVFGSRSGTVATRVMWVNGDAWGAPPGETS